MEKHEYPETLEVKIIGADLKGSYFRCNIDCPLARALKRMYPKSDILVGGCDLNIDHHESLYNIDIVAWNNNTVDRLQQAQKNKKKCSYTLVLKRN